MTRSRLAAILGGVVIVAVVIGLVWWRFGQKPSPTPAPTDEPQSVEPVAAKLLTANTTTTGTQSYSSGGFPLPTGLPQILGAIGARANSGSLTFARDGDRPGWEWFVEVRVPHKTGDALQADLVAAFKSAGFAHDLLEKDPIFSPTPVNQFRRTLDSGEEVARTGRPTPMTGSSDGASGFRILWRIGATATAPAPTYAELTKAVPQLVPDRRGPVQIPEKALALFAEYPVRRVQYSDAKSGGYITEITVIMSDSAPLEERLRSVLTAEGFEPSKRPGDAPPVYMTKRPPGFLAHCTIIAEKIDGGLRVSLQVQTN